jgi:hypothetical protein
MVIITKNPKYQIKNIIVIIVEEEDITIKYPKPSQIV